MILCSCNVLTRARIEQAAATLALSDPLRPVTPGRIFRELGYRPRCGTCFELVQRLLIEMGLPRTCPEPLASVADGETTTIIIEQMEIAIEQTEVVVLVGE